MFHVGDIAASEVFYVNGDRMIINYKIILQYDGTRYNGWQKQGNTKNTIQGKIEETLAKYFDQEIELHGSGRTDAGVHAVGQVANFKVDYKTEKTDEQIKDELNSFLPEDIKIVSLEQADSRFHARLNATEKEYRYYISLDKKRDVFTRKYMAVLGHPEKLDAERMKSASAKLIGEHDFQGFSDNKSKKSTIRRIDSIQFEMHNRSGEYMEIIFRGDGFLYHTVRFIVGTLLAVGMGEADEGIIDEIFDSRDRRKVPYMAPAEGLFLYSVEY